MAAGGGVGDSRRQVYGTLGCRLASSDGAWRTGMLDAMLVQGMVFNSSSVPGDRYLRARAVSDGLGGETRGSSKKDHHHGR